MFIALLRTLEDKGIIECKSTKDFLEVKFKDGDIRYYKHDKTSKIVRQKNYWQRRFNKLRDAVRDNNIEEINKCLKH